MTDQPSDVATQADADAARQARIAALAGARSTKRRRHPAQGARIAAAGLGTTTLLGLVGAFALAQPPAQTTSTVPVGSPPEVVVVVHHIAGPDTIVGGNIAPADPLVADQVATRRTTPPTVRPATTAPQAPQAPAASTRGSH